MPTDNADVEGICIALANDTLELDQTWVSLESYVVSWETQRGRQYELDKVATGTATITLTDSTGYLDISPGSLSAIASNFVPFKQIRIAQRNPVTDTYTILYTGFVQAITESIEVAEKLFTVTITCVDGFDILANSEVVPDSSGQVIYAPQTAQDRIKAALADAKWLTTAYPNGLSTIFSGNVDVQATTYQAGTDILTVCQDAADAEFPGVANFYVDKLGVVTFHGRLARFNPSNAYYGISSWAVGDEAAVQAAGGVGVAKVAEIEWQKDGLHVVNAALVTPLNVAAAEIPFCAATDPSSITAIGTRSMKIEGIVVAGGGPTPGTPDSATGAADEALLYAYYYTDNYATAPVRLSKLVFKSLDPVVTENHSTWQFMCQVELGDLVMLTLGGARWPGGGGFPGTGFFVEGIKNEVKIGNGTYPQWTMTLDVSPQALYTTSRFGSLERTRPPNT